MHPKLKGKKTTTVGELKMLYHIGQPAAMAALKTLTPITTLPYSRGTMRIYDTEQACQQVEAWIEKNRRAPDAPQPAPAPVVATPAPQGADLGPLTNRVLAVENQMEALVEQMTKVASQNTLIFKAVGDLRIELLARLDALHSAVDNPPIVVDNPQVAPKAPVSQPDKAAPLRVVGIVGLLGGQREMIKQEFGALFNLRFYESDDAKTKMFRDSVRGCEVVLAMKNFINHSVDRVVIQEGTKLELINGGVTSLRNRLTAMYVNETAEATV